MSDAQFWAELPEKLRQHQENQERKAERATNDLLGEIESAVIADFIYPDRRRRALNGTLRLTRKRP